MLRPLLLLPCLEGPAVMHVMTPLVRMHMPWRSCMEACMLTCRQEGHVPTPVGLDISLPAACITRQLSLWYHLRKKYASQGLYTSTQMYQDVVDLKEALRWMIGTPLAKQLGVPCDREGDLRVMLAYLHPASSPETDFLFISGGKGRGYKRKRGQPKVIHAGMPPHAHKPLPLPACRSQHAASSLPCCCVKQRCQQDAAYM